MLSGGSDDYGSFVRVGTTPQSAPIPPYTFFGSRTVCSMYEVGQFKLDAPDAGKITGEVVRTFQEKMRGMTGVAAFVSATAADQPKAAQLLGRAGFKTLAEWPGNATPKVTFWFRQVRHHTQDK